MSDDEAREFLAASYYGVLSTVGDDQPYAVPVIYGFDGESVFSVMAQGRKTRNMDDNPNVCFTVVETADTAKRWKCTVAIGRVEWVEGAEGIAHGLEVIRRQYPGVPVRSQEGQTTLAPYRMARIRCTAITGRKQGF